MKPISLVLLLAIILSACAPAPTPTPTPVPPTATPIPPPQTPTADFTAERTEADRMLQNMTNAGGFSGSVLLARNAKVILSQGYGFADRAKKIPNTPQTKLRIADLTLAFTAMAILMLQEQGKLTVQGKVCKYLADCPDAWKPITLHQLLTHSAGIPDTLASATSLEKMIAEAKAKPLDFQPGGGWNYNCTGFNLLGKVIEAISGQTYEAFLQKNIFDPLQMSSTGYDHGQADLAVGYFNHTDSPADLTDPQILFACEALYSTVEDLYAWDQALYTEKLVSQKALDAMFTTHVLVPGQEGDSEGYGWALAPGKPRLFFYDSGFNGFTSVMRRYPDDKTTIIILTNQQDVVPWDIADMIAKKLFGK